MQLGSDSVELVFHEDGMGRDFTGVVIGRRAALVFAYKALPDRFRGRLGTRQHRFDRTKQRQLCSIQFPARREHGSSADIAQQHVGLLYFRERSIKRPGDRFLNQAFPQTNAEIAG